MSGFVSRLDEINALADGSPGFVWRLQTEAGDATSLRPYDDDRIIVNLTVWESLESLRDFVYRRDHAEGLRKRQEGFERLEAAVVALGWIPAGHVPSVAEAKERLLRLQERGPSPFAFTFQTPFPPDEALARESGRPAGASSPSP